jgi:hypothetical protein
MGTDTPTQPSPETKAVASPSGKPKVAASPGSDLHQPLPPNQQPTETIQLSADMTQAASTPTVKIKESSKGPTSPASFSASAIPDPFAPPSNTPGFPSNSGTLINQLRQSFLTETHVLGHLLTPSALEQYANALVAFAHTATAKPTTAQAAVCLPFLRVAVPMVFMDSEGESWPIYDHNQELLPVNLDAYVKLIFDKQLPPPVAHPIFKIDTDDLHDLSQTQELTRIWYTVNGPKFAASPTRCCLCMHNSEQGATFKPSRITGPGRKFPEHTITASHFDCPSKFGNLSYYFAVATPSVVSITKSPALLMQEFMASNTSSAVPQSIDFSMPSSENALTQSALNLDEPDTDDQNETVVVAAEPPAMVANFIEDHSPPHQSAQRKRPRTDNHTPNRSNPLCSSASPTKTKKKSRGKNKHNRKPVTDQPKKPAAQQSTEPPLRRQKSDRAKHPPASFAGFASL